ncbi:MAG: oligosaccharide flippase family protein, partial [Okeania sp. SIO2F4]|uniref:oligosaccharide flippase family protein n=1 Tax=Okeania sp. SIO2F4 TaxID=2607790 RepID=UPI00142BD01E
VIMVYLRTDQIMLGEMLGESAVGIYAAIAKLSEMLYLIPNTVVQSVFPTIIKAQEVSKELYYQRQQKLFSIVTAMNYAFAIPITFISTSIVTLIYGENYAPGGSIFAVHVWSGLFVSLGVARSPCLIAEGLTKFSAAATATGAVVNIILNYFLIIKYGMMGAAISTIISQIIASYACHSIYPKTKRIFIEQTKALLLMGFWKK